MTKRPKSTPLAHKLNRDVFFGTAPDLPRIIEVDLVTLRSHPDQPRRTFDPATIQDLAASIAQHGLIQPIAVARDPENPAGFFIVAGERRFRAFQHLGRDTMPAILTTGAPDEIALIENIQRENLHPLDEAQALANLMRTHHYTQEALSQVIGKARSTITESLRLTRLPQVIQEECRTSDIVKSTLIELSRLDTADAQLAFWEQIKAGRVTVREARAKKKHARPSSTSRQRAEQTLAAGRTFVRRLQEVATENLPVEPTYRQRLHDLRDHIVALIEQLEPHESA